MFNKLPEFGSHIFYYLVIDYRIRQLVQQIYELVGRDKTLHYLFVNRNYHFLLIQQNEKL